MTQTSQTNVTETIKEPSLTVLRMLGTISLKQCDVLITTKALVVTIPVSFPSAPRIQSIGETN